MFEPKANPTPTKDSSSAVPGRFFPVWLLCVLLMGVAGVLYWPSVHWDFINYDDPVYVWENPHVQAGLSWSSVKWAFCNQVAAHWHPVTVISLMANCQWLGLKPWGFHLVNLLFHCLNAALVFILLRELTGATWRSFFVAMLFAVHPVNVESVAWVSERKNVLSTFLGLLTLIFYARYAKTQTLVSASAGPTRIAAIFGSWATVNYALALIFLAIGLMTKAMLVTWPFVMLLLDFWPLQRFRLRTAGMLVAEKTPFFVLVLASCAAAFIAGLKGETVVNLRTMSLMARGQNVLVSYCRYIGKTVWPSNLCIFYPMPKHWPWAMVLFAGVLLAGISLICFMQWRRHPFLLMGWLWFCGTLVPVVGFVQIGAQAMADHYAYITSLGLMIMVTWGAHELTQTLKHREGIMFSASFLVIALCFVLSRRQLVYWQDSEHVFSRALAVTTNNATAHDSLGNVFLDKGQTDEAISHYLEAIRLDPIFPNPRHNLGLALVKKGRIDEAIGWFQEAVSMLPSNSTFHYNLGIAFNEKGRYREAIEQFEEAIRLTPDNADAHLALGTTLGIENRLDDAITQFQEVIRLKPNRVEAYNNLGIAFGKKGQSDRAIGLFREAIRLSPDYFDGYSNLGDALYYKGELDEAIREFQEACRLRPDDALIHQKLDVALSMKARRGGH